MVRVVAESILLISSASLYTLSNCIFVRKSVLYNNSNQYFVSDVSFSAMYTFETKSLLLIAHSASAKFAPMDVPERNSCLDRMYSLFSLQR